MNRQSMAALAIAAALGFPAHASAFATRFVDTQLSARVIEIDDPNAVLGAIQLGNIVLGRFAFDPDLADRDPAPGSADWTAFGPHDPGLTVLEVLAYSINDLSYRGTTIPQREAIDDGQTGDLLRFGGCEGPGVPLRFCFLAELADANGNALEGTEWPTEIDLTQWSIHTLSIFSPPLLVGTDTDFAGPRFSLRAEITDWRSEVRPIPEPGAVGIFGLGLALVARRRGLA
jgi:hypothetical protein